MRAKEQREHSTLQGNQKGTQPTGLNARITRLSRTREQKELREREW